MFNRNKRIDNLENTVNALRNAVSSLNEKLMLITNKHEIISAEQAAKKYIESKGLTIEHIMHAINDDAKFGLLSTTTAPLPKTMIKQLEDLGYTVTNVESMGMGMYSKISW